MSSAPSPPPSTTAFLRPWPQFLNPSALSLPISLSESTYRVTQNLSYFLPNYSLTLLLIFSLTLITQPLSLLLFLAISAAWIYLLFARDEPVTVPVLDYEIDRKIVVGFLSVVTLVALFWAHVWVKLFVAVVVGGVVVLVHAVLRAPEDSMEDSPYGSLLNVVDDGDSDPRGQYASV